MNDLVIRCIHGRDTSDPCAECKASYEEALAVCARPLIGGTPIDEYIAELERDPAMKVRLDEIRERLSRKPDAARDGTGVRT